VNKGPLIRFLSRSFLIFFIPLCCLLSCGLDDIPYIDYIPDGIMQDNTSARIWLPSNSDEGYENPPIGYFIRFEIYYRIYISGVAESGEINTSTLRTQINNSLHSDFESLKGLTDKTNTSNIPTNLDTTFNNRRYFKLTLEEDAIDNVLGRNSLGQTLDIRFSPINGELPVLMLNNGSSYTLRRAVSGLSLNFNPKPENRYFLNHQDLNNTANATNDINADVASNTATTPAYTYVSMYIFAIGKDYLSTIYSQPTHIGVFRLAESF
jgi:hypothetical protein